MRRVLTATFLPVVALLSGCGGTPTIPVAASVELDRFMGDWYVIASIPTRFEVGAHNAVESYRLDPDGTIATTFKYRDGAFDGEEKVMRPRGFVRPDTGNAVWGMQFVWPIKAEYLIAYVDPAYTQTIVARSARDYVWIMARSPELTAATYAQLEQRVRELGYDTTRLQRVPQRWPAEPTATPAVAAPAAAAVKLMSQEALLQEQARQPDRLFVLDVRTPEEFAAGHVPRAVNVPHEQIASRLQDIPRDKDIVIYCRSGRRSGLAADVLAANGYTRLSHLEGDMLAWTEQGRPVETP